MERDVQGEIFVPHTAFEQRNCQELAEYLNSIFYC